MIEVESNDYCNPENLMRMVEGGSRDAIDRITRCYGQRLLTAGQRYCRTHSEAEDAVQDALLQATLHLRDFRGEGSLEGWLVRIVASACRRISRGLKRDDSRHVSDRELRSSGPSPYDLSCRGELSKALQNALLALDPEDRMVLLLAEAEGYRSAEIAAELGLTAGAVRTRLSRLRARLRTALLPYIADT